MKKSILARGFIGSVASLLGVVAVGCSGEVMDEATAGNGEIGSVAQAIVAADIDNLSTAFDRGTADKVKFGAHCTIEDANGNEYMLIAGGIDGAASGDYSDQAVLFDGASYSNLVTFTGERAFASMVQVPGSPNKCLMGGGENASGKVDQLVLFTLTGTPGSLTLTPSNAGKLSLARAKLQAVPCGTDQVLFMGGGTGAQGTYTESAVMDVWDGQTGTTAIPTLKNTASPTAQTVTLNVARHSFFADVKSSGKLRIALAGGRDASGFLDNIEALQVTSACALDSASLTQPLDISALTFGVNDVKLAEARSELVGVHKSSPNANDERFVFAIGRTGASTVTEREDVVDIDFVTPASSVVVSTTATNANLQPVANPAYVKIADDRFLIVGGVGDGDDYAQEYSAGTWTDENVDNASNALETREGASIAVVGSDVIYTGGTAPGTTTFRTSTFQLF